jgi:hypothetical protein
MNQLCMEEFLILMIAILRLETEFQKSSRRNAVCSEAIYMVKNLATSSR